MNQPMTRRAFVATSLAALAAASTRGIAAPIAAKKAGVYPYSLPPLPYSFSALSRSIDAKTMQIHHDKHHQKYVDELNKAVAKVPQLQNRTPQELLRNLGAVPANIRTAVKNNAGGHVNHSMFWQIMSPNGGGQPHGALAQAINRDFGSLAAFQKQFDEAGVKRFGSGWVWLVRDSGKLKVITTPNQDNPMIMGLFPIMGNDVWEHAYYLRYQNRRADYLKAWWSVANWPQIEKRYAMSI
jgi:Fe-Mn family superoxide dismutase